MRKRVPQAICCLLALAVGMTAEPVQAKSFFTSRRAFGVLFLGGSAVMAKKAVDFRQDANRTYGAYRLASTSEEAARLYDRTGDYDTKSKMSVGLSVVLLASGLRLILSSGVDDTVSKIRTKKRFNVDMKSDVNKRMVKVAVKRHF
jgi:hypothetical protein